jgi:4-amino-4-deoxy-L-arabinose transferase-like glycosyltransferase
VLFWTLAMLAGWRAVQGEGSTRYWLWTGLWMGLGFLSKYTQLFQLLCWACFFLLWPPARKHLRRSGPYLALLVNLLCTLPVVIWNAQRKWVTVSHLADRADLHREWHPIKYFSEFILGQFGLLNPIFFVAMIWAAIAFWKRRRHDPKLVFFFSMGAPLFLCYLLFSFRSRVLPNWIAPAVLPLFCVMVIYWDAQWRLGAEKLRGWLTAGLTVGFTLVVFAHNTDLVQKVTGRFLPVKLDPLHRIRVWDEVAKVAGDARQQLLAEGMPVFIIGDTYQLTGIISFYLPEAKARVT